MDNEKNNVDNNNKKVILLIGIVLSILVVLVFSATYAYFSVNTSNNFGSSTIDTTAEGVGSIALSGTNANLLLSVSRTDMMRDESPNCKGDDCSKTYYASSSGKTLTPTEETIGTIAVTGNGNFTCTYTLNITHTGTKDLYDTFKSNGYTNKGDGQIILTINGEDYDWNSDGMPTTITKTVEVSSGNSFNITAGLRFINNNYLDQTYLAGTDININISVPSGRFRCTIVTEPQETIAYYTYDANGIPSEFGLLSSKADSPNSTWQYYVIETSTQTVAAEDIYEVQFTRNNELQHMGKYSLADCNNKISSAPASFNATCVKLYSAGETYTKVANEVCAVFSDSSDGTVCLKSGEYANVDSYYTKMHNLGLACSDYQQTTFLRCSNGTTYDQSGSLYCDILSDGSVDCGLYGESLCTITSDGLAGCGSHW